MSKEGLGIINWWGFSPALDFFTDDVLSQCDQVTGDINVLLVGCGDCRHVIKTVSSLYRQSCRSITFYIAEHAIELYARQMIQMIVALIPPSRLGLQDKTELFLELYGNSLVREQSMEFVRELSNRLIRLITDPERCTEQLPFLDLDHLTFKERDILESVFKIWRDSNPKNFEMAHCWDLRVRQHLGTRYDAIPNVFDWDCSITLHDRGAFVISSREYSQWRQRGVAFQLRDGHYDASNRTLASGRVLRTAGGDKTVRIGYWGDIVVSPYIALGIISSNQALFRKANNRFCSDATRVAEYNVSQMFHQLAHGTPYEEVTDHGDSATQSANTERTRDALTSLTISELDETECDEHDVIATDQIEEPLLSQQPVMEAATSRNNTVDNDVLPLSLLPELAPGAPHSSCSWHLDTRVKLVFLPLPRSGAGDAGAVLPDLLSRREAFKELFDLVYLSVGHVGQLGNPVLPTLLKPSRPVENKPGTVVVVETPQFVVDVSAEQLQRYIDRSDEMALAHGLEPISANNNSGSNITGDQKMRSGAHLLYRAVSQKNE